MRVLPGLLATSIVLSLLTGCNQTQPPQATTTPAPASTPMATATTAATPSESATPAETATPSTAEAFEKTLTLQEHTFVVTSDGSEVNVAASGLELPDEPQVAELDGTIVDAEVEDLDANGFPEVYIYVTSNDEKKSGHLIAFASNNGKSITPIYLPPLDQVEGASEGYKGGDELRVVENRLVQRWSIYKDDDADGQPSGGTRQIQWRLEPGEATWTLVSDKVETF
jgi:hypothetical protein